MSKQHFSVSLGAERVIRPVGAPTEQCGDSCDKPVKQSTLVKLPSAPKQERCRGRAEPMEVGKIQIDFTRGEIDPVPWSYSEQAIARPESRSIGLTRGAILAQRLLPS